MLTTWQTTREAWKALLFFLFLIHAFAYGVGLVAIAFGFGGVCIAISVLFSVFVIGVGLSPDIIGITLLGGFLWGLLPAGPTATHTVNVAIKSLITAAVNIAFVNSFMFLFLGTWDFGQHPKMAGIIIAASLTLGYWGMVYREGEWFKKVSLWYGAIVIILALLNTIFPVLTPDKVEKEIAYTEALLEENESLSLITKQRELQKRIREKNLTSDQLTSEEVALLNETKRGSHRQQLKQNTIQTLSTLGEFVTDPDNRALLFGVLAVAFIGLLLLKWSGSTITLSWSRILRTIFILVSLLVLGLLLLSSGRDVVRDAAHNPKVKKLFAGNETTRSLSIQTLKPEKLCGLKPNARYTFVSVTTAASDRISFRTIDRSTGVSEAHRVTGLFYSTPEDLPYQDSGSAYVPLLGGVPVGRIFKTQQDGCVEFRFNVPPSYEQYRGVEDETNLGFVIREVDFPL
ncbi:MAG: hypothetical protein IPL87_00935 [Candidatus Moraniibacteriota bacterium]|nr:MAG: hypothetical protein IPL87_00935 [Candidatus Moranbacteria bacterium]